MFFLHFNLPPSSFYKLAAFIALMKSTEEDVDIHIHNSRVYPSDSPEYKTFLQEYNQKYELEQMEEHMRSMEPEEVE